MLAILNEPGTLEALLAVHEEECDDGDDCPVAAAMRRRLGQLRRR